MISSQHNMDVKGADVAAMPASLTASRRTGTRAVDRQEAFRDLLQRKADEGAIAGSAAEDETPRLTPAKPTLPRQVGPEHVEPISSDGCQAVEDQEAVGTDSVSDKSDCPVVSNRKPFVEPSSPGAKKLPGHAHSTSDAEKVEPHTLRNDRDAETVPAMVTPADAMTSTQQPSAQMVARKIETDDRGQMRGDKPALVSLTTRSSREHGSTPKARISGGGKEPEAADETEISATASVEGSAALKDAGESRMLPYVAHLGGQQGAESKDPHGFLGSGNGPTAVAESRPHSDGISLAGAMHTFASSSDNGRAQAIELTIPSDGAGAMHLRAVVDKDGKVHATVTTHSEASHHALTASVQNITTFLESERVRVDSITVAHTQMEGAFDLRRDGGQEMQQHKRHHADDSERALATDGNQRTEKAAGADVALLQTPIVPAAWARTDALRTISLRA